MHHRTKLLAGICGLVLGSAALQPAMAAAPVGFAGTFGAGYANTSCDGCDSANNWNVNGSGAFGFAPNIGGEIDASYNNLDFGGTNINLWGVGGSVFWAPGMGRGGATLQYSAFSESGFDFHTFAYGLFGEYFASPSITVGVKGGGLSVGGSGFSETGGYIGAGLIGYFIPNLAVTPEVMFASISDLDITSYGISGEFLISETTPISIFGGYTRTHVNISGFGSGDTDTFKIGVKLYTNGNGVTLVDRQRNGTLGWAGSSDFSSILQGL